MAQFNIEVTPPGLPITASSGRNDVVRLQESAGRERHQCRCKPWRTLDLARQLPASTWLWSQTAAGCSAFAAANGLAERYVDAASWRALTPAMDRPSAPLHPTRCRRCRSRDRRAHSRAAFKARRLVNGQLIGKDNSGHGCAPIAPACRTVVSGRGLAMGDAGVCCTRPAAPVPARRHGRTCRCSFHRSSPRRTGGQVRARRRPDASAANSSSSSAAVPRGEATSMSASPSRRSAARHLRHDRGNSNTDGAPTDSKFAASSAGGRPATSDCSDRLSRRNVCDWLDALGAKVWIAYYASRPSARSGSGLFSEPS